MPDIIMNLKAYLFIEPLSLILIFVLSMDFIDFWNHKIILSSI